MIRDTFTPGEAMATPPSMLVRPWHTAIGLGLTGAIVSFVGMAFVLWRPLPLLGAPPAGEFGRHLSAWGNVLLYAVTGGNVGRAGAHEYLDLIADLAGTAPE